jgi:alpha-beta hydrolase superfamily lysophospholipase
MLQVPAVKPARSFEEALERVRAFKALDNESIVPEARTSLLDCGARTPIAVVLLHGLTNHPGQFRQFAPMLFERGVNVFVPRLPEQGDRDRMTRRLAGLTAEALLASASEAVDIACGLGERVCVLGISSSGLLCTYFAQYRGDVARAVPVAPVFAILQLPYWLSSLVAHTALALPNAFLWWDPTKREAQLPPTAYPQFPTHALAQCMRIGEDVYRRAAREAFDAKSAVMVTNSRDPAVNNAVAHRVAQRWGKFRPDSVEEYVFTDLPRNHDIIDPDNPVSRVDLVYPRLLEVVMRTP